MNGTEGEQAQKTRLFARNLEEKLALKINFFDERLTTASAHRTLLEADMSRAKRKKVVDKVAAVYILQAYMDKVK
jgi:putative Holliday junction resolvase